MTSPEFTCPKCGSHYFSTSYAGTPDKANWIGLCKGPITLHPTGIRHYAGCEFTWRRSEDGRYFR